MDTNQRRRPAGTPSGGRFAGSVHTEAGVTLTAPSPDQVAAMSSQVALSAKMFSRQDETIEAHLAAKLLDQMAAVDPAKYASGAYIHAAARRLASKELSGLERGPDFEAHSWLNEHRGQWETRFGSEMPRWQVDAMAENIRQAQGAGRRAREGFHLDIEKRRPVPLDVSPDFVRTELVERRTPDEVSDLNEQETQFGRFDEEELSRLSREQGAWAGIAHVYDAPRAQPGEISEITAARIRRQVTELGGVGYLAAAYLNGEVSRDGAATLFAPFGGQKLDETGRLKLTQTLTRISGGRSSTAVLDAAFDNAVKVATRQKPRPPRKAAPAAGRSISTEDQERQS